MALNYGFFNSVNGDRRYDARWFAKYFATFIGNGIFPNPSNGFQVFEHENMTVAVKAGQGWINGYYADNDADYYLTLDNADGLLKRIDRIVLRWNQIDRVIELAVRKGTFASNPVPPVLQRDGDFYELGLADVLISNGTTQITQANITDTRFNAQLCGVVKGVVDQIDTTNLFAQYNAAFEEWFATIQGILDGDVAANLAAQILNVKSEVNTHSAQIATETKLGHVKPDGTTITVDPQTGVASANVGFQLTDGSRTINTVSAWGEQAKNIDEILDSGIYFANTTWGTKGTLPSTNTTYQVIVLSYRDAQNNLLQNILQIAFSSRSNMNYDIHMRSRFGTTWGAWIRISSELNDSFTLDSSTIGASSKALKLVTDKLLGSSAVLGTASIVTLTGQPTPVGAAAIGDYAYTAGNYSLALGSQAGTINANEGVMGATNAQGVKTWKIPGSLAVTGTKNFEMPHPNPDKMATHVIRHSAVESPTAGDNLYRYTMEATKDGETVELLLPDYFQYLNKDVDVYVSSHMHFGRAFGIVVGDVLKVTCEKVGIYKVLVIGTRDDNHESVQSWEARGVEREIGESWTGETYAFEVDEITDVEEITEVL